MLIIAHTALGAADLKGFQRAVPHAQFVSARSIADVGRLAAKHMVTVAIVTTPAIRERGCAQLSVLKEAEPALAVVAYLDAAPDLLDTVHVLGRAGSSVVVRRAEDHPEALRPLLRLAGTRSVVDAIDSLRPRHVPLPASGNIERALRTISTLQKSRELAAALGTGLGLLRAALWEERFFQPRLLLAVMRMALGSRLLGDTTETVERIGMDVGYSSGPAFHNATHHLIGATPGAIRDGGGLRYVLPLVRARLGEWRSAHGFASD